MTKGVFPFYNVFPKIVGQLLTKSVMKTNGKNCGLWFSTINSNVQVSPAVSVLTLSVNTHHVLISAKE